MAQELFQKVAYIGLRNADGSFMLNVPLYVKISELNKNGMTDTQEKVLPHCHCVASRKNLVF